MILFLILVGKIMSCNLRTIPLIADRYSIIALGVFGGLVGLFVSYIFSQGFWIPFTWIFLAFNIATLRIGTLGK